MSEPRDPKTDEGRRIGVELVVDLIRYSRRAMLELAHQEGLTEHEALHSWVEGVKFEYEASMQVCVEDYCSYDIAARRGITREEVFQLPRKAQEQARDN